eukprot:g54729.t1
MSDKQPLPARGNSGFRRAAATQPFACTGGNSSRIHLLPFGLRARKHGAVQVQDGVTALHHAAHNLDLWQTLIDAKANPERQDKTGVSAVDLLVSPPYWQVHTACVLALWAASGAAPPKLSKFATPLHYLASLQDKDLKEAGSQVAKEGLKLSEANYAKLPLALCHSMLPWIEIKSEKVRDDRGLTALEALRQSLLPALRKWARSLGAFLGRYLRDTEPSYQSATCSVYMAEDVQADEKTKSKVALKLITGTDSKNNFKREQASRSLLGGGQDAGGKAGKKQGGVGGRDWLVDVLRWEERHLCLVMPAADYSLNDYLRRRNVSGKDMQEVRCIAARVAQCLQQVHARRLVHGDLKPNNIVFLRGKWALIDFDGAAKFGLPIGHKYSSAYCPPELACVIARFRDTWTTPEAVKALPLAEASFDVFSFGVLLYELCTGEHLFPHVTDNIADERDLQRFSVWLGISDDKLAQVFRHAASDQNDGDSRNSRGRQVKEGKSGGSNENSKRDDSSASSSSSSSGSADHTAKSSRTDRKQPEGAAQDGSGSSSSGSADHRSSSSSGSDRKQPEGGTQDSGHESREESISKDPRDDVRHLIRWCLQLDPKDRPTVLQVLSHRFLDPKNGVPPPTLQQLEWKEFLGVLRTGSQRMKKHVFISHMQAEASGDVGTLALLLEMHGASVWRDMSAKDLTEEGMRQGVADCDVFILFLTNAVLSRPFCLKEISWALEFGKPFVVVLETDVRFFPFEWDRWTRDELQKLAGWNQWEKATNLGSTYEQCRVHPTFRRVHDKVQQLWTAHTMIPYRRREFEANAMVREIFRQAGDAGCMWGKRLPPSTPLQPPLLDQPQLGPATSSSGPSVVAGNAARRWPRVFLVQSERGADLAKELRDSLETNYPELQLQSDSVASDPAVPAALEQAERVVVLLTGGLLAENSRSMQQLRYAVQHGLPLFALYSEEAGWQFGGDEQRRAVKWVMEVVGALEAMVFRKKADRQYEFVAMCDELLARMTGAFKQPTALSDEEVKQKDQAHQAWLQEEEKRQQEKGQQAEQQVAAGSDARWAEHARDAENRDLKQELAKVKENEEAERKKVKLALGRANASSIRDGYCSILLPFDDKGQS